MKKMIFALAAICVCAAGAGIFAACSQELPEEEKKLNTPDGLIMDLRNWGPTLFWDEVEFSDGYIVEIDGSQQFTYENYILMNDLEDSTTIKIKAFANKVAYTDSDWVQYTYRTPNQYLSYSLLEDESGYEVKRAYKSANTGLDGVVVIPDYFEGLPVKAIAEEAFYEFSIYNNPNTGAYCNTVTTQFILPSQLEKIGRSAFECCIVVTDIDLPETVTIIEDSAFADCRLLKFIDIPENIESLGRRLFYRCHELTLADPVLPDCATDLSGMFLNCHKIDKIVLPDTLTTIGSNAFYGTAITEIIIPEGVTEIDDHAFASCNLTEITIPEKVERIGERAFSECDFTEINIPDSVKVIGDYAFADCENLAEINLGNDIQELGQDAFAGTAWYNAQPDGYVIIRDDILCNYKGDAPEGTVIDDIPEQVKYIATYAFYMQNGIVSAVIPGDIEFIGSGIFFMCKGLKEVTVCSGIKSLPERMFSACSSLESVSLPETLEHIGNSAFMGCTSLKSIDLPDSLKTLGSGAFDSSAIETLAIPDNVEELPANLCRDVTSSTKPSLKTMVIPESVKVIDPCAYGLCKGVTIFYKGTEQEWNNITFLELPPSLALLQLNKPPIYFYSEEEPPKTEDGTAYAGNFWHYVDGQITIWSL